MAKTELVSRISASVTVKDLLHIVEGWILDGEIRLLSAQTLNARRIVTGKLLWFLGERGCTECGTHEIRSFLAYITRGHEQPDGRWNNRQLVRPVRPRTVQFYFANLQTLFRWAVEEGVLSASPMAALRAPVVRHDQVQPFTAEQVRALEAAARRTHHPRRDEALVAFLLDTGCRASEICGLINKNLDLTGRKARIDGKGGKQRTVYFGKSTTKLLWTYLREEEREPESPVFVGDRGTRAGEALTRSGLLQLIHRLGEVAGIESTRCSPHTFRHTFSVLFLRNGGNVFTLKELLGHTSLTMVNRYLALAQADLEAQHRAFSPVDRLKRGRS